MEKFYTVYTGKNSSIKSGQNNFENLIGKLDDLAADSNFVNALGEELVDNILNIAEDNIEQYHIYNYIPQDEEVQAYREKRKNQGFLQPPVGSFNQKYYLRNTDEAVIEGLAMQIQV